MTREDVARRANTSGATVSRVLSGRTDIPILAETRARVLQAAAELGYTPNPAARALTNGKTGIIGLWMSLAYSKYRGQVLDTMRSLMQVIDFTFAVTDIDEEYHFVQTFDRALRVPLDGIIAFDTSYSVDAFTSNSNQLAPNIPFVSMGAYWSEEKSYVGIDLRAGSEQAMAHLLSTGRQKIAYFAPATSDLRAAGPRYEGYLASMEKAGLNKQTLLPKTFSHRDIQECLTAHVSMNRLPEALLCMNDEGALICAQVLSKLGVKVGQDIALVGFDGIEETEFAHVPITTVAQPYEEMCRLALEYLHAQINDPSSPLQQKVLVPQLVIRESSAP